MRKIRRSVRVLGNLPTVAVNRRLTGKSRCIHIVDVVTHSQNELVCGQFFLKQAQSHVFRHFAEHQMRLFEIIRILQNLTGAYAV